MSRPDRDTLPGLIDLSLLRSGLDRAMPMHLSLTSEGIITGYGGTLARILGREAKGKHFNDVLWLRKPRSLARFETAQQLLGKRLILQFAPAFQSTELIGIELRGEVIQFPSVDGTTDGGFLLNTTLGSTVKVAVERFDLRAADFPSWDITVDLYHMLQQQQELVAQTQSLTQKLESARVEAEHLALTDGLTGLLNRRGLMRRLDVEIEQLDFQGGFGLLQIDLDRFKSVNDTLGHDAGDAVLRYAAAALRNVSRPEDASARIGGDEFIMVIGGDPSRADVQ
ncbi:MAG: GGDEF domain-containing protein, partial [Pseudomonadota bacterium]